MLQQELVTLQPYDGEYHNFFRYKLKNLLINGWVVKEMDINKENETGWVLLEKVTLEVESDEYPSKDLL